MGTIFNLNVKGNANFACEQNFNGYIFIQTFLHFSERISQCRDIEFFNKLTNLHLNMCIQSLSVTGYNNPVLISAKIIFSYMTLKESFEIDFDHVIYFQYSRESLSNHTPASFNSEGA